MLLQFAAALIAQATVPPGSGLFERAEVVRVSRRPTAGSGILMILTDFDVLVAGDGRHRMNMIYFGEDQFIPPVGSICSIRFDPGAAFPGLANPGLNMVRQLDCDTGRDSVGLPGDSTRIEGVRIVGRSQPPRPHARLALYIGVDVDSPGRTIRRLYLRRQGDDHGLPAVGSRCAITYHLDWVTGRNLGNSLIEGEHVRVVDEIDCGTRTGVAH